MIDNFYSLLFMIPADLSGTLQSSYAIEGGHSFCTCYYFCTYIYISIFFSLDKKHFPRIVAGGVYWIIDTDNRAFFEKNIGH